MFVVLFFSQLFRWLVGVHSVSLTVLCSEGYKLCWLSDKDQPDVAKKKEGSSIVHR